jgi:hypothetical protein
MCVAVDVVCDAAVDVVHDVAADVVDVVCDVVRDVVGTERRGHDGTLPSIYRPFENPNVGPQPSSCQGAHDVVPFIRVVKSESCKHIN